MEQRNLYSIMHGALLAYLNEGVDDDEELIKAYIERIENDLPVFISNNFGVRIDSIYNVTDSAEIERYRVAITNDAVLKSIDRSLDEPSYSEALRTYRRFLCSRLNPLKDSVDRPLLVPGETKLENSKKRVLREGAEVQSEHVTHYERNQDARKACIEYYKERHEGRIVCECCGFDFSKAYPGIGEEYIEVHHLKPISQGGGEHPVVPEKDLVPLCSNCHSMIHREGGQGDCMSLEELKSYYKGINYNKLT